MYIHVRYRYLQIDIHAWERESCRYRELPIFLKSSYYIYCVHFYKVYRKGSVVNLKNNQDCHLLNPIDPAPSWQLPTQAPLPAVRTLQPGFRQRAFGWLHPLCFDCSGPCLLLLPSLFPATWEASVSLCQEGKQTLVSPEMTGLALTPE